ncbi:NADH-quinone oxidoreductase subunit N [Aquihabitans sp. G128]|uniref:NADH-quinone oxidoreductase subunit N n=1 Tax=Aquihabitans sp. G128 TaxID=2849779 RepID=UPI001C226D5E|nr:NADH-quinone oxidoreductase subunit N [Aquihabitans sp. G128]QXC60192.1 NADH-quinone oxidoreductase subunit N [Aquihabitans sp. G128]
MLAPVLAASSGFTSPHVDWHALAPEIILVGTIVVALLIDLFTEDHNKGLVSSVVGLGMLASFIPLITLGLDNHERVMFGGAYVVDDFALVLKGLFLVAGYLTVLLSTNTIAEGDYHEGEYYLLLLSSVLGMTFMASARDLISIFVALEMLSIPAYLLASWRKRTQTGIEAGMKYYLMGVFATAVMLYGMSLIFGGTGSTLLTDVGAAVNGSFGQEPVAVLGIVFVIVGFAFKVSAVPFHNWAPDTYEGAPTPVTAFLSVASKTAGFVAILQLVFLGFFNRSDTIRPFMFVLAVLTMTVGNVIALRQTNVVRLFAYSSVAQAGFILAPLAVISSNHPDRAADILSSIVLYLIVYTIMNLGAFAVIITVSRRTQSGEITSWAGLFTYAPGLAVAMGAFLFGLGGIPPAAGWFAKFQLFNAVVGAGTPSAYALGVIMAANSVISLAYYLGLMRTMFMDDPVDGDVTPVKIPVPLRAAVVLTGVATILLGVLPFLVSDIADGATFVTAYLPGK